MRKCNMRLSAAIFAMVLLASGCKATTSAPADGGKAMETTGQTLQEQPSSVPETAGLETTGLETAGPETTGPEITGTETTGLEITGPETTGPETTGLETNAPAKGDKGEDQTPVYGSELKDGVYSIKVDSSSSMFQITACELTVKDHTMSAVMTMGGKGYLKLFIGTGEEALKASDQDFIPFVETKEGTHTFTVPVKALDIGIDCSAFSKNKEKWYDRVLVFRSDSLPLDAFADGKMVTAKSLGLSDGRYTANVSLDGGSGRATVESPASLRVEGGKVFATIVWGSSNYDYMKVDDKKYEAVNKGGNSTFEIPVMGFDWKLPVSADTTAMSQPHEISYTLMFDSSSLKKAE